jgi:hypothetical protein
VTTDPLLQRVGQRLKAQERRLAWFSNPALFAEEAIDWPPGTRLADYQRAALAALVGKGRVAVRSPHGAGKTTTAALAVLWFAVTRDAAGTDWKCICSAGSWRQLERYLWPEIHLWQGRLRWKLLGITPWRDGKESFDLGLKLAHGEAFAGASDNPALLEGAHADSVLLILDEAKSIPGATFDAVEGAMSGTGQAFAMAVSTPAEASGRFYDIHARKPGLLDWATQHVTLADAVAAGRVSQTWADQRALQWGSASSVYLNRVLGQFASGDADSLIPLAWVEQAIERWRVWDEAGRPGVGGRLIVGVDVARFGTDRTAIALRRGNFVIGLERHTLEDTMQTVGRVVAKLQQPSDLAVVDVIGLGSGVVDRLREQRKAVRAFNAAAASPDHDRSHELGFANQRAAAWWRMRELLDPAGGAVVALPDDDELVGDLCSPRWKMTSAGKVLVESKDDIRKRLGRSPDVADAVIMCFTERSGGAALPLAAAVAWNSRTDVPGGAVPYGPNPWERGGGSFGSAEALLRRWQERDLP